MLNPVLKNKKSRIVYLLLWVIIMMAHSFFLIFYFDLRAVYAVIDGLVYNLVYLLFGIGIWYIVRYNDFELIKLINLVGSHALSAVFILSLWLGISGFIVGLIVKNNEYATVADQVFPARTIFGILFYAVIVLVYYLLVYYHNFKERIRHEAHVSTRYKEAELNALKSQINPHFIFNSLNSISSMTISDPDKAQEMIVKLSEFFRMTLKNGNLYMTTLNNELYFSRLYFEIEKIRFGDKLEVKIEVPESFGSIGVPHLILQPLLENAIKHGVQESLDVVEVKLSASQSDGFLLLVLKNHFDKDLNVRGEGIGLSNVRERLRLMYGMQDLLMTGKDPDKNEYIVTIKIPLNEPEDGSI
ncbi:MAG: histidine kinase [Cyclobacteriaceae bacterium]|nr:histidine kinase [Cyclobacteriaceae bacterium]